MKRSTFIKSITGLGIASTVTGLYAWQIEPFWLEFTHHPLPIKNLPQALSGKILMQISDLHVGNRFNYQYLIESFEKAKKYEPDFVAYTGD